MHAVHLQIKRKRENFILELLCSLATARLEYHSHFLMSTPFLKFLFFLPNLFFRQLYLHLGVKNNLFYSQKETAIYH